MQRTQNKMSNMHKTISKSIEKNIKKYIGHTQKTLQMSKQTQQINKILAKTT